MENRKYNIFDIGVIVLFITFPFISLPVIFKQIYKGKKYPLLLLAIFMGGVSMYYFPHGDQYRYFYYVETYKFYRFNEIFNFSSITIFRDLNLIQLYIYGISKIGLNIEIARFILTFISCCLIFDIYWNLDKTFKVFATKTIRFISFLIFFFAIPYYLIWYGFRTGFGACLFTYSIYLLYFKKKKNLGFIIMLLASFTHFLFALYLIIFLINHFVDYNLNLIKTITISFISLFCSFAFLNLLSGRIDFVDYMLNAYVYSEEYGKGSFNWLSIKAIPMYFNGVFNILIMFIAFFRLKKKGKFENIIYILFILCMFSFPYATFFQRIVRSSIPIIALYVITQMNNEIIFKMKRVILFFLIIAFLYPFWYHRVEYKYARFDKLFYSPLSTILSTHYDNKMVHSKVDVEGHFYK